MLEEQVQSVCSLGCFRSGPPNATLAVFIEFSFEFFIDPPKF